MRLLTLQQLEAEIGVASPPHALIPRVSESFGQSWLMHVSEESENLSLVPASSQN